MKKALLLINPISGKQSVRMGLYGIVSNLSLKYEVTLHLTKSGEDVIKRAAACEFPCLIVCGGDGTLSGAVDGLLQNPRREEITLGYIPCGTSNDVAATLEIPRTLSAAALYVLRNSPKKHDVGLFNNRPFIYTASFGTFTKVSYETPQDLKNVFGPLAYVVGGAGELLDLPAYDLEITTPDKTLTLADITFAGISNTHCIGGGILHLPPDVARLDDGLLEFIAVKRPHNLIELENILRSLMMQTLNNEYITLLQAPSFHIASSRPVPWTLDGETGGEHEEADIACLPGALNFLRK